MKTLATALLVSAMMASSVSAQSSISSGRDHLIETYHAYISRADVMNSDGQRLGEPWQIIRQDRANFHRFHLRDRDDESDSFFASADNRQKLESMLANGSIEGDAAERIVDGDVHIKVSIYGHGNIGDRVDVSVDD